MVKNIIFDKNTIPRLRIFFFSFSVFCYYAQFLFRGLSLFIVPMLMVYMLLSFNKLIKKINKNDILLRSIYYIFISYLLIISAFSLIEINRIMRFFLILVLLPMFFFDINSKNNKYIFNTFIIFSCLKSISLIIIFIIFLKLGSYNLLRNYFLNNGGGSIYSTGGNHLYIQVHGNALLLIAFMLRYFRTRKFDYINILLFIGLFLAGNFAFYLGLLMFFIYCFYKKIISNKKEWYILILFVLLTVIIGMCIFLPYVKKQIELKSTYSNVVRIEQADILLRDNIFTGNGIGNKINAVTSTRTYNGDNYFELQTLYIINQIGFTGYFLFMFVTLYIFYKKNKYMIIIYLIYLLYSFWNPYCFDTTHMITVSLLINEKTLSDKKVKQKI